MIEDKRPYQEYMDYISDNEHVNGPLHIKKVYDKWFVIGLGVALDCDSKDHAKEVFEDMEAAGKVDAGDISDLIDLQNIMKQTDI